VSLSLLSIPRETGVAWGRAIATKEARGEDLAAELWADHLGDDVECFLCGAAIPTPPAPFTLLMPDKAPDQVIGAPLCAQCAALPPMLRSHRCIRLWRNMCARPGRQSHW
jgi:hypothetical protein